jgi:large subunit ribosomal protein L20
MRVKRGLNRKRKHKATLAKTKGYRMSYSKLVKRAKEATLHAEQYSFAHRRKRQGQFRRMWLERINAALSENETGVKYGNFIHLLNEKKVQLNRKVLADLALNHSKVFTEVVKAVK